MTEVDNRIRAKKIPQKRYRKKKKRYSMEDERATVRDSAKFDTSAGEKKMVARHRGNEFKKIK